MPEQREKRYNHPQTFRRSTYEFTVSAAVPDRFGGDERDVRD
jgi:hypothetical protein